MDNNTAASSISSVEFLIVGGGIAGVSCAETLTICYSNAKILLLTESNVIKMVTNLVPIARYLHRFDVREQYIDKKNEQTNTGNTSTSDKGTLSPHVQILIDTLKHVNDEENYILTHSGRKISYRYLCLCTGAKAHLIDEHHPAVIGIRDTDSVRELQKHLSTAQKIALVGNGGIATELAQELTDVEIHWIIKDSFITSTFLDPGAAEFFQQAKEKRQDTPEDDNINKNKRVMVKRLRYQDIQPLAGNNLKSDNKLGSALGPDWHQKYELKGARKVNEEESQLSQSTSLVIHYRAQVASIDSVNSVENFCERMRSATSRFTVTLSNGLKIEDCDFVISATGVKPRINFTCQPALKIDPEDGGILVNEFMQSSLPNIYAAGDICTCNWQQEKDENTNWFQMRLWTQARQMGSMAGRSMAAALEGIQIYPDFCFELFGHVTQLFGMSVILIGCYNGQNLGSDYEILIRCTPGVEYIKFVLQRGRLRGALLIGNTELAETCENLILNGIDLTPYGDDILNPGIDIEDYFD